MAETKTADSKTADSKTEEATATTTATTTTTIGSVITDYYATSDNQKEKDTTDKFSLFLSPPRNMSWDSAVGTASVNAIANNLPTQILTNRLPSLHSLFSIPSTPLPRVTNLPVLANGTTCTGTKNIASMVCQIADHNLDKPTTNPSFTFLTQSDSNLNPAPTNVTTRVVSRTARALPRCGIEFGIRTRREQRTIVMKPLKSILSCYSKHIKGITRCGLIPYIDGDEIKDKDETKTETKVDSKIDTNKFESTSLSTPARTFIFGMDRRTQDLTDFGGSVCFKKDDNVICTAIREAREESLGVFDDMLRVKFDQDEMLKHAWAVTDMKTMIIFWKIECSLTAANDEFVKRLATTKHPEVSKLMFLPTNKVIELLALPKERSKEHSGLKDRDVHSPRQSSKRHYSSFRRRSGRSSRYQFWNSHRSHSSSHHLAMQQHNPINPTTAIPPLKMYNKIKKLLGPIKDYIPFLP